MIGSVRAPEKVGKGDVLATLACPDWQDGKVEAVTCVVTWKK